MDFRIERAELLWWSAAAFCLALFVATLGLQAFDRRLLAGESVWAKPLKFYLALALHFATLALAMRTLSSPMQASTLIFWVAIASTASAAFEMTYIMLQAARQEASHFNLSTPFHARMYTLMAIGAVVITLAAGVVGAAAWFDEGTRVSSPLGAALTLGLIGGTILTLIVAFRMGGAMTHHVGVEAAGAARVPLTGWSRTVGDLRAPHFFATHMMQAVPAAGLIIERAAPGGAGVLAVVACAALWTALTLYLFMRALSGQPFPW